MECLDAERMLRPILQNFNENTVEFLKTLNEKFNDAHFQMPFGAISGSENFQRVFVLEGNTYSANIKLCIQGSPFLLHFPYLIMIGSHLDILFRIRNLCIVTLQDLQLFDKENYLYFQYLCNGETQINRACCCFIVSGNLRQICNHLTNSTQNFHGNKCGNELRRFVYTKKLNKGVEVKIRFADDDPRMSLCDSSGQLSEATSETLLELLDPEQLYLNSESPSDLLKAHHTLLKVANIVKLYS